MHGGQARRGWSILGFSAFCFEAPTWHEVAAIPPRPSKTLHTEKHLGELVVGSLHNFRVIHCASGNHTWKADFFCVIHGVGLIFVVIT